MGTERKISVNYFPKTYKFVFLTRFGKQEGVQIRRAQKFWPENQNLLQLKSFFEKKKL